MNHSSNLNVAILGAGLIGLDLLTRIQRSPFLDCQLVVGRNEQARGLRDAAALGCRTADGGIESLVNIADYFDIVFDASNATSHSEHWEYLKTVGSLVIDLTPSMVGHMTVPTVNGADVLFRRNVNLISCGGQASVPVLHALAQQYSPRYIEVVTTAASTSVGRATRLNLDEHIETTQTAICAFTGVDDVKAIVNISPARPPSAFRVVISMIGAEFNLDVIRRHVASVTQQVRTFAAGYHIVACEVIGEKAFIAVEITASGNLIPQYAGNLDIINSAAMVIAERYAISQVPGKAMSES